MTVPSLPFLRFCFWSDFEISNFAALFRSKMRNYSRPHEGHGCEVVIFHVFIRKGGGREQNRSQIRSEFAIMKRSRAFTAASCTRAVTSSGWSDPSGREYSWWASTPGRMWCCRLTARKTQEVTMKSNQAKTSQCSWSRTEVDVLGLSINHDGALAWWEGL